MARISPLVERAYQATAARILPSGERMWPVRGGRVALDITEYHTMMLRVLRLHERAWFRALGRHLPAGGTFVDVGANRGDFTVWAAARGARVVCYEPSAANVASIERAVRHNGFDNVEIRHAAVSATTTTGTLHLSEKSGWHTLVPSDDRLLTSTVDVDIVALDDELDRADALKVDVEGAELDVLRGAERLLRTVRIAVVDVDEKAGTDPAAIAACLEAAGLEVHAAGDRVMGIRPG